MESRTLKRDAGISESFFKGLSAYVTVATGANA